MAAVLGGDGEVEAQHAARERLQLGRGARGHVRAAEVADREARADPGEEAHVGIAPGGRLHQGEAGVGERPRRRSSASLPVVESRSRPSRTDRRRNRRDAELDAALEGRAGGARTRRPATGRRLGTRLSPPLSDPIRVAHVDRYAVGGVGRLGRGDHGRGRGRPGRRRAPERPRPGHAGAARRRRAGSRGGGRGRGRGRGGGATGACSACAHNEASRAAASIGAA